MALNIPDNFIVETFSTESADSWGPRPGVKITHKPTGVSVQSSELLTAWGNRRYAWALMREALEAKRAQPKVHLPTPAVDPKSEPRTQATPLAQIEALSATPEYIRSILVRCRDFIDTTKVPAYPAGADLADEIDALLAVHP